MLPIRILPLPFIAAAVILTTPLSQAAPSKKELARCAAVETPVPRLECYDKLARKHGAHRPKSTTARTAGKWTVSTETSAIDDSTSVFMSVLAKEPIRSRYGKPTLPKLMVRCMENTTAIYVDWNVYLGIEETQMTHRIDSEKAVNSAWKISTSNNAAGKWRGHSAIPFIKKLLGHDTLLAQVVPYGQNPVMVQFPITGLDTAIKPLRKACGW